MCLAGISAGVTCTHYPSSFLSVGVALVDGVPFCAQPVSEADPQKLHCGEGVDTFLCIAREGGNTPRVGTESLIIS